ARRRGVEVVVGRVCQIWGEPGAGSAVGHFGRDAEEIRTPSCMLQTPAKDCAARAASQPMRCVTIFSCNDAPDGMARSLIGKPKCQASLSIWFGTAPTSSGGPSQ